MNAKSFLTKMERRLLETRAEEHPLTELTAGVLGARMERGGGGHRFPSRLLVPSLFPPFLHLHHLPENLQVPCESPIKSATAGGGGGTCSLSTPGSQQAL